MATTNSDRQARYRARMKRRTSPEGLVERIATLVDDTVEKLWAVLSRPGPDGEGWAEAEGFADLAAYRGWLAAEPGRLAAAVRDMLWAAHLLDPREQAVFSAYAGAAAALDPPAR